MPLVLKLEKMKTEYKTENFKLEILQDEDPRSPREDCDGLLGKMMCFHKRYILGDQHDYKHADYNSWAEMRKAIIKNEGDVLIIKDLYLYDHSGITISTAPFTDPWDSGQIGFIIAKKSKVRELMGVERISDQMEHKVSLSLEDEVKTYDEFIRGNVYGFKLYEIVNGHERELDSCWGFYGDNIIKNGIFDNISHIKELADLINPPKVEVKEKIKVPKFKTPKKPKEPKKKKNEQLSMF